MYKSVNKTSHLYELRCGRLFSDRNKRESENERNEFVREERRGENRGDEIVLNYSSVTQQKVIQMIRATKRIRSYNYLWTNV